VYTTLLKGAHFTFVLFILAWALPATRAWKTWPPRASERGREREREPQRVSASVSEWGAGKATEGEREWENVDGSPYCWCFRCRCCWHAISRYQWQTFCQPAVARCRRRRRRRSHCLCLRSTVTPQTPHSGWKLEISNSFGNTISIPFIS